MMTRKDGTTREQTQPEHRSQESLRAEPSTTEFIRALPRDLLEPHPLVKELRIVLQAREASLADKDKEIARLQVAVAFGIKELPHRREHVDGE
ncbi:MAG: hypothetical protein E4H08_07785 [Candidatus Atribacteria bacterium]|nr:MAG: hypothetical protein E4H08_07785 [Candidatus Atribacteria bacterium]